MASERRIRKSQIRFLEGDSEGFLCPALMKRRRGVFFFFKIFVRSCLNTKAWYKRRLPWEGYDSFVNQTSTSEPMENMYDDGLKG